mgnify:CR=1 FL=1
MIEAAFVFDIDGNVIAWHLPPGRSGGSIPDSRDLWSVMWENREILGGVAHTHPWRGTPWPSGIDVTTFSACERGLGRRLVWPIITFDRILCFRWRKTKRDEPGSYMELPESSKDYPQLLEHDIERLRELSGKQTHEADDKPLDAPFEPDWASPPGDTIAELLEKRDATSDDLARMLSLTREQMSDLMKGTLPLTEKIATDLCSIFGVGVQFWLNREKQYRYDLARLARQNEGED